MITRTHRVGNSCLSSLKFPMLPNDLKFNCFIFHKILQFCYFAFCGGGHLSSTRVKGYITTRYQSVININVIVSGVVVTLIFEFRYRYSFNTNIAQHFPSDKE